MCILCQIDNGIKAKDPKIRCYNIYLKRARFNFNEACLTFGVWKPGQGLSFSTIPVGPMYVVWYIYLHLLYIKVNHSCRVNVPVPWDPKGLLLLDSSLFFFFAFRGIYPLTLPTAATSVRSAVCEPWVFAVTVMSRCGLETRFGNAQKLE